MSALYAVSGCKGDKETRSSEVLGQWEVTGAERNGRITETLDGAYFNIGEDGRMETNLPGYEEGTYRIDGTELHFEGTQKAVFLIDHIEPSEMHLSVELMNNHFMLVLERKDTE